MIIAPVIYESDKKILSFKNFQALEFISLQASTAGAVGINSPIMCNGANLIYERELFHEFSNPLKEELISGDDILSLIHI